MRPDIVYSLPCPPWWPGPGGGQIAGYATLVCLPHTWRKLPCVINRAGMPVGVEEVRHRPPAEMDQNARPQAVFAISATQLVEARDFCHRYSEYVNLEEAVAAARERGARPEPEPEYRPYRPSAVPAVQTLTGPSLLNATPEQEAHFLVRALLQDLTRLDIVPHDRDVAARLLTEAVLETVRWDDSMICAALTAVLRHEEAMRDIERAERSKGSG